MTWILNYAETLFPDNNFHIFSHKILGNPFEKNPKIKITHDPGEMKKIAHDLETHGISHIFLGVPMHAVALSIIKDKVTNKYYIIYMDSNNWALDESSSHFYEDTFYKSFKPLIIDLKNNIEQKLIANK